MTTPTDELSGLIERLRPIKKALEAIAEGYRVAGEDDRYVVVSNPDADDEAIALKGLDPNICLDLEEVTQTFDQIAFRFSTLKEERDEALGSAHDWKRQAVNETARADSLTARVRELESAYEIQMRKCDAAEDCVDTCLAALRAVQNWMDMTPHMAGHPGPVVLLDGYPKDEVDAAVMRVSCVDEQIGQSTK